MYSNVYILKFVFLVLPSQESVHVKLAFQFRGNICTVLKKNQLHGSADLLETDELHELFIKSLGEYNCCHDNNFSSWVNYWVRDVGPKECLRRVKKVIYFLTALEAENRESMDLISCQGFHYLWQSYTPKWFSVHDQINRKEKATS